MEKIMEIFLGACARAKCRVVNFKDYVPKFEATFQLIISQPRRGLFEVCKSLEPTSVHGELNGRCFGCVCAREVPRSALLRLTTKIWGNSDIFFHSEIQGSWGGGFINSARLTNYPFSSRIVIGRYWTTFRIIKPEGRRPEGFPNQKCILVRLAKWGKSGTF